jgi:hypothetical protein
LLLLDFVAATDRRPLVRVLGRYALLRINVKVLSDGISRELMPGRVGNRQSRRGLVYFFKGGSSHWGVFSG